MAFAAWACAGSPPAEEATEGSSGVGLGSTWDFEVTTWATSPRRTTESSQGVPSHGLDTNNPSSEVGAEDAASAMGSSAPLPDTGMTSGELDVSSGIGLTDTGSATEFDGATVATLTTEDTSFPEETAGVPLGINPLEGVGTVEVVDTGFRFLEGPLWLADAGVLLFTDIDDDMIYQHAPAYGWTEPYETGSGIRANGLTIDERGGLIICEHATRRVVRRANDGVSEIVADAYEGMALNSPNDAVVHPNGTIYFTDPPYGGNPRELTFDGVYRVDPAGGLHLVQSELRTPNGIVLSPDGRRLYVSFTQRAEIWSYPVLPDGTTEAGERLASVDATADGMAIDQAGNLYATSVSGVVVLDPTGAPWGTITLPEQPSNCTFGGDDRRTLYITARRSLYAVAMRVPGLPPP